MAPLKSTPTRPSQEPDLAPDALTGGCQRPGR